MLETIRRLAMVRISNRNTESQKHEGILTPYAEERLALEEESAKTCKIKASTNGTYEVEVSGCSHRVSLDRKTCTCRKYQISGIPCVHAYGLILDRHLHVEEFVSPWFHTLYWKRTYAKGITPLRGARFWPRGTRPITFPCTTEKKGKKEKRKKGKCESPTKKADKEKRVMHCGICGQGGHNCRFHKPVKDVQAAEKGKGNEKKKTKAAEKKTKGTEKNKTKAAEKNKNARPKKKVKVSGSQTLNEPE